MREAGKIKCNSFPGFTIQSFSALYTTVSLHHLEDREVMTWDDDERHTNLQWIIKTHMKIQFFLLLYTPFVSF